MPRFSKFTVFENDMREFIDNAALCVTVPNFKDNFTQWIYEEGIVVYLKEQATNLNVRAANNKKETRHPNVTYQDILESHLSGLIKLIHQCTIGINADDQNNLCAAYNLFLNKVFQHKDFFLIQANVYSTLYHNTMKHPSSTLQERTDFAVKSYEMAMTFHPALTEAIQNEIILKRECHAINLSLLEIAADQTPPTAHVSGFFRRPQPKAQSRWVSDQSKSTSIKFQ